MASINGHAQTHSHTRTATHKKRAYHRHAAPRHYNRNHYREAYKALNTVAREAKVQLSDVQDSMVKYVKTNPWKAIGASALAGLIVFRLFLNK